MVRARVHFDGVSSSNFSYKSYELVEIRSRHLICTFMIMKMLEPLIHIPIIYHTLSSTCVLLQGPFVTFLYSHLSAYIETRVSRPNPFVCRVWGPGGGRQRKGCRPPGTPRGAGDVTPHRTPRRSHFYDELFYRACRRFSFSIFYVYFPETINYVWKKGTLGRRVDRNRGEVEWVFCFLFLFFMVSHVCGASGSALLSWLLHYISGSSTGASWLLVQCK